MSQYYYPEQFQINEIAPELVRRGHEVTVICGLPNYPQGKIYPGYKEKSKREELLDGVKVIRCKQLARGSNPMTLVLNYLSFVHGANKVLRNMPPTFDVIFGYELSPITSMLPVVEYKKLYHIPALMYCLDQWPVSAQSHLPELIKEGIIYRFLLRLSRRIYSSFERIAVTSRPFIDYLNEIDEVPKDKMIYIPQHADSSMLQMDMHNENDGIVNFMYAGNIGAGSKLDVIVKAANILGHRIDYKIHIVGDGSKIGDIKKMVSDCGLNDNFIFHGNQKRSDMPKFYRLADALLLTLRGNNAVGNTMPGKFQMYMTTGKPILGAINGAASDVIKESGCGKCVKSGDYKGLATLMKDFIDNPGVYAQCGMKAREYFMQNFTFEKFMNSIENELKITCKNEL